MAKRVEAESISEGVSRIKNFLWPEHGNATEHRRSTEREIPEDTSATGRAIQKERDEESGN
jgi:hypothetical protein